MAASPSTGHLFSQMPQPVHFSSFTMGRFLSSPDDGLVGALLVADEADLLRIPGDAPGLVDVGDPHLDQPFLFDGTGRMASVGQTLAAEIAELLTVADTGDEPRGIKTCQARLQEGRLEGVIGADLQTLPAARAGGDELSLREGLPGAGSAGCSSGRSRSGGGWS